MKRKFVKAPEICTRLAIELGTELQLEIKHIASKFKSEMVGMEPNSFLITKLPLIVNSDFLEKCRKYKSAEIIARYLYRGVVFGFKSQLIDIINSPTNLMFISYPKRVEELNIRKNERISCMLPGKIKFGAYILDGTILDLSLSGCKMTIIDPKYDIDILEEQMLKFEKLQFMFHLPGEPKAAVMNVLRKNTQKGEGRLTVGMEFHKLGADIINKVNKFIITAHSLNFGG